MGRNGHWFEQWRARGLCYICRWPIDNEDRVTHERCNQLSASGKTFKLIRALVTQYGSPEAVPHLVQPLVRKRTPKPPPRWTKDGLWVDPKSPTWRREALEIKQIEARQAAELHPLQVQAARGPNRTIVHRGNEFEVVWDGT